MTRPPHVLFMRPDDYEKLPFWQKDYFEKIEKMTWGELLDEVIELTEKSWNDEPLLQEAWQVRKATDLLVTRISEMEDELMAFQALNKEKIDAA